MTARPVRSTRPLLVVYWLVLALTTVFSLPWLAVGALVAATAHSTAIREAVVTAADEGSTWAAGVLDAAGRAEPLGQAVLDYAFSALSLLLAVVLLTRARGSWVARLLALAMVGSAGAFNLQAHGATVVVERAVGLGIGQVHQVQLHGVACAAYIVALLLFPTGRWQLRPGSASTAATQEAPVAAGLPVLLLGAASLVLVGVGTALLPHTVSCILFFGFAVPLVGLAALRRRTVRGATADLRSQARLLFSALVGAFGTIVVLALITFVLLFLRQPGLTLVDPTAPGSAAQPTALLFWFSRLSAVAIAAAALVATRRGGLWFAERVFSRGLASVLVVVLIGGGWVVVRAVIDRLYGLPTAWASIAATLVCSVGFLPLYQRVEQLVERLLYGSRPTPYRVLADVAALSGSRAGGPNLAAVAEAIGRALGARSCRLTVLRPGLRDRTYGWDADSGPREWTGDAPGGLLAAEPADHLVLPISQGSERIGTIAVDRGAVAGLQNERRHLLEDVADSLGAILQASRLGIELERQLRAALAHAEEIAGSRRAAVAEMDSERRAIERDLHDGAQHHLVTLRLALGLVEHEVAGGRLDSAREKIGELGARLRTAETVLAKTATGVSSIVLAEQGLVAALRADLAGVQPPVTVEAGGAERLRFPVAVEAAVYFCCLESVNNARKHAGGAPVTLRVDVSERALDFEVRDSGPGFTPPTPGSSGSGGRGLRNLTSRITGVGGTLTVESAPGEGTTVRGRVPFTEQPRLIPDTTVPDTQVPDTHVPDTTVPHTAAPDSHVPDTAAPAPTVNPARSVGPALTAAVDTTADTVPGQDEPELLRSVRDLVEAAVHHGSDHPARAELQLLRDGIAGPLRVGVLGRPDLVSRLASAVPPGVTVLGTSAGDSDVDQVHAVLVPPAPDGDDPGLWVLPTSGALTSAEVLDNDVLEPDRPAACGRGPGEDGARLRCDAPAARLTTRPVAAGVFTGSVPLARVFDGPVLRRAQSLRARAALVELDELVRAVPDTAEAVLYQLEQVRAGTHELAEMELLDALADGSILLHGDDRAGAERLLGLTDDRPTARLGLAADATPDDIRAALTDQLTYWRRQSGHPAVTSSTRRAAEILVRTCESLLSRAAGDRPSTAGVTETAGATRAAGPTG
ncbi:MAG: ATP-binding protein [Pseudonocardia sp.]